eukprot:s1627_g13.t2
MVRLDTRSETRRWLLLLGAAVTFVVFAPRGLLVGLTVLALLGARVPQRLLQRLSRVKESLSPRSSEQEAASPRTSLETADVDWGPALVLVFEAKNSLTGIQQLRIRPGDGARSWSLEDLPLSDHPAHSPAFLPEAVADALERMTWKPAQQLPCSEMLKRLTDAGLEYRLGASSGGDYIFCSVRLPEATVKANLSFYHLYLELHPARARTYAAELGMPLAVCTRGGAFPEARQSTESFDSRAAEADFAVHEGLPDDIWEDLHVRFYPNIPSRVFRHVPLVHGKDGVASQPCSPANEVNLPTLLLPSERLRLLLSLVADDMPGATGEMGAGFKLDQWKRPKLCNCLLRTCRNFGARRYAATTADLMDNLRQVPSAFSHYFLMQDPRDGAFSGLRFKFGLPSSPLFRSGLLSGVVDKSLPSLLQHFFGQQIGFYFAFLQHLFSYGFALTVLLAPLLAVYSVDWAQHVVHAVNTQEKLKPFLLVDEFAAELDSEAAKRRWPLWSLMVGLTTTIWGQCVIESWHRQEQRYALRWGSWKALQTHRAPRPAFRGRVALSRVDGRLVQLHHDRRLFQARVIAVNLCFLGLWVMVFLSFYILRTSHVQVATENYASMGAMFSVVSVLLYHLFRVVAHILTDAENHREEDSWETSILVKKWALTVIVQCSATMHLLFIRPWLWPCAYGSPDIRHRLGIEGCALWDKDCCDVELHSGRQVLLSFAQLRREAVVRHARQFVAGWLVSKIFTHNLLKWIVPRLFGFLCNRGLYPLLAVDFAEDVLTDLAMSDTELGRRRVGRSRLRRCLASLCARRAPLLKRWQHSATDLPGDAGPSNLPKELTAACECQLDKQEPWDVLDTATDLSVHFLVTSLTTVIYPFAPLLFLAHLVVEFQVDLFQLLDRRQPKPRFAKGLPRAWLSIFQSYVYIGALSNLAIVTWRTTLVEDWLGREPGVHVAFFSTAMLLLVFVLGMVHLVTPATPTDVIEHLQREREVEAFFIGHASNREGAERQNQRMPIETTLISRLRSHGSTFSRGRWKCARAQEWISFVGSQIRRGCAWLPRLRWLTVVWPRRRGWRSLRSSAARYCAMHMVPRMPRRSWSCGSRRRPSSRSWPPQAQGSATPWTVHCAAEVLVNADLPRLSSLCSAISEGRAALELELDKVWFLETGRYGLPDFVCERTIRGS